jgi:hypothetical protein
MFCWSVEVAGELVAVVQNLAHISAVVVVLAKF